MKNKVLLLFLLIISHNVLINKTLSLAQVNDSRHAGKNRPDKEAQQSLTFAGIDSLVRNRQFVFQAEYSQESYMVFVLVDSIFGEVQNGNRNNLQGRITEYEVKKNEKKKTLAVTIKMRGEIYSADVFLFIGASGSGKATVRSEYPGSFSFNGNLVDFENASIYEDPSHLVHRF